MLKTNDGEVLPLSWVMSDKDGEGYYTLVSGNMVSIWKVEILDAERFNLTNGWRFCIDRPGFRVILKGDSKATALEAIDAAMALNEGLSCS